MGLTCAMFSCDYSSKRPINQLEQLQSEFEFSWNLNSTFSGNKHVSVPVTRFPAFMVQSSGRCPTRLHFQLTRNQRNHKHASHTDL